jgi:hypothetical protein
MPDMYGSLLACNGCCVRLVSTLVWVLCSRVACTSFQRFVLQQLIRSHKEMPRDFTMKQLYARSLSICKQAEGWHEHQAASGLALQQMVAEQNESPLGRVWVWTSKVFGFMGLAEALRWLLNISIAFDRWCYVPSAILLVTAMGVTLSALTLG